MRPSLIFSCAFLTIVLAPVHADSLNEGTTNGGAAHAGAAIAAAINHPDRYPPDLARDAGRKPEAVLAFAGLREGMSVLDLFSGSGYYTELAAYVVGPRGRVVAHNNTPYSMSARNGIAERFANGRLASVERILGENNSLALPAAAFDVALLILCYHDIYYLDGQRGWERIDRPRMLAELYSSLKPGGAVVVIDHVADADTPAGIVAGLHRIDPALVKADFIATGFLLDAESDILSNPDDPRDVIAMAPQVRGKTDRAMLRFSKPALP